MKAFGCFESHLNAFPLHAKHRELRFMNTTCKQGKKAFFVNQDWNDLSGSRRRWLVQSEIELRSLNLVAKPLNLLLVEQPLPLMVSPGFEAASVCFMKNSFSSAFASCPLREKIQQKLMPVHFLSKTDYICSLPCGLASYLIVMCEDIAVKNWGGRKCVFFVIWYVNVKYRWHDEKKGRVVVHNSDLEQLVGDHCPGNICYSFLQRKWWKIKTGLRLRVICITWTMYMDFFHVSCTLDSLKSGTVWE